MFEACVRSVLVFFVHLGTYHTAVITTRYKVRCGDNILPIYRIAVIAIDNTPA